MVQYTVLYYVTTYSSSQDNTLDYVALYCIILSYYIHYITIFCCIILYGYMILSPKSLTSRMLLKRALPAHGFKMPLQQAWAAGL